jgi:hypothetical protein
LKVLAVDGLVYWPSVLLRIMLERTASHKDIREAGFNPEHFPRGTDIPVPFRVDLVIRLLQRVRRGTDFTDCAVRGDGWKYFHDNFRRYCDKEDKSLVYRLGTMDANRRLNFMCERNMESKQKFIGRLDPNGADGSYSVPGDYPFNPLEGFAEAFEKMMGLDQLGSDEDEDEDENSDSGKEDESSGNGPDESTDDDEEWDTESNDANHALY